MSSEMCVNFSKKEDQDPQHLNSRWRIKPVSQFAITHAEQFARPCIQMRVVGLQLLDTLARIEPLDRRFQIRSRIAADRNGTISERNDKL